MDKTRALRLLSPHRLGGALLVGLLSMTPASAAVIIHNFSIPLTELPVDSTLPLVGFDPGLGTLTGIHIDLSVHLDSDYGFENRSGVGATISSTITSTATLRLPSTAPLHTVVANITRLNTPVGAYDGTIDFVGASGRTYENETADETSSVTLNDGASLAFFSTNSTLLLPFDIEASSTFKGASNIIAYSLSSGAGDVTITYEYTPISSVLGEVPEPGSLIMMGLGGVFVGLLRVRRAA